ncbi:MAG: DUF2889 domain-containing protein [Desulfobacteraceae bacterium]|nr:DUF2889 domain-containing protein [Desulfobacteraceae bacterium]
MSRLKDLIKEAPVHERRLELRTYPVEEDQLIVEGWLRDDRLVPGYHWDGRPRPSGVVHWICVRLLVGGWPLSILDAEAEMPSVPHELCPTTLESVKKIVGLSIVSGYSEEVRNRLGGIKGCTHLTHLVLTMGPAAIHGYWTQRSRECRPVPRLIEEFPGLDAVINSCKLWREDGPLVKMVQDALGKP